jgi:hypothetical protein
MSLSKRTIVFFLLACSPACGRQVVHFVADAGPEEDANAGGRGGGAGHAGGAGGGGQAGGAAGGGHAGGGGGAGHAGGGGGGQAGGGGGHAGGGGGGGHAGGGGGGGHAGGGGGGHNGGGASGHAGVDAHPTDASFDATNAACRQTTVNLRSAAGFAVLGGSTVTNGGLTVVAGDLGVSPGTDITGFPPGVVVGAQHAADPTAAQGIADLDTAYNDAKGRTLCPITVAGNLGGLTLAPGLYMSTSSLEISSGDLTLDGQGDSNAIFIFQMATTLTTTVGRQVILTNGAAAANIFWQVGSSATLGTSSVFDGTIMADQTITLNTGATLNGRALAHIGAVNLDGNSVVRPL